VLEDEVKPVITAFLSERGLSLSEDKTRITHIEEGFNFLGFNIRKYQGKLLIKPAKESIKRVMHKIRNTFKANSSVKTVDLIKQLNPLIRGWVNPSRGSWERQWKTKEPSKLKTLWFEQNGLCPACQDRLSEEEELDTHHLKPKALGGADTLDNLVLLHSTCHKQAHHFHGKEASPGALRRLIQA
jgi:hypothetical protein